MGTSLGTYLSDNVNEEGTNSEPVPLQDQRHHHSNGLRETMKSLGKWYRADLNDKPSVRELCLIPCITNLCVLTL